MLQGTCETKGKTEQKWLIISPNIGKKRKRNIWNIILPILIK